MANQLRSEKYLLLAALVAVVCLPFTEGIGNLPRLAALLFALAMVGTIILAALRIAHHAELLAEHFGEPYGTMILTISAVLVEVIVLAIMISHEPSSTLARDTIYSAVMLDLNGIVGISALIGGLKHGEQKYNVDTGNSYIVMILTAMAIAMVVPEFVPPAKAHYYSIFTIAIMLVLYGLFLALQTGQHSYFFSYNYRRNQPPKETATAGDNTGVSARSSVFWLLTGLVLTGALSEVMAPALSTGLRNSGVPKVVPGILIALISASPEILTALRSALANRMQSTLNVALGASLSTVILTVPVIEAYALFTGHPLDMAMTPVQTLMIFVTLLVATINLHDGETNAIEGKTHLALFLTFLMLSAIGL